MKLQKKDANGSKIYNIEECLEKISGINDTVDDINAKLEKISHIEANAEVNQEAFSNVKIGSTTIAADSKKDILTIEAGSNITLTPDATNDKITIATTNTPTFTNLTTTNLTTTNLTTNGEIEIYGATQEQPQPHIDFHYYSDSPNDYTSRIIENSAGAIDILAPKGVLINGKELATSSIELNVIYDKPKTNEEPRLRDFSYTAKYVPIIPAIFVRFYGVFNKDFTNQTGGVQIIKFPDKFPDDYKPNFQTALSVHSSKKITLVAKSSGIYVNIMDTGLKNYAVWGAGFWFV